MSLVDQIHQACRLSLSGNNVNLSTANEMFNQMFTNPEFGITAMNIISNHQEQLVVKQIVSINLKHFLKLIWESVNDEVRHSYKELLMQLVIRTPIAVQTQIVETLRFIIIMEFPEKCVDLLQNVHNMIQNTEIISNETSFKGLMLVINLIAKINRYNTDNYPPMIRFIGSIFPFYLQILTTAIQNKVYSYTKLCFKLFKYIIYTKVPAFFTQAIVDQFYSNSISFLQQQFTFSADDESNAQCSSLIGLIRGTCSFVNHNTSKASRSNQIVTYFIENVSLQFLNTILSHFNVQLPRKLMFFEINLLSYCLKTSKLAKVILQFFPVLFEKIIFPQIMVTPNELEEMRSNPVEFLRSRDEEDDFGDTDGRTGSINFIRATLQYRAQNFLPLYIQPLFSLVPISVEGLQKDPRIVDCACFIIGKICNSFVISPDYAKYVPAILSTTVPLLLNSGNTLLIRRGCDLAAIVFNILNFNKTTVLPDYIIKVVQIMFNLLSSNDVIARVSAGSVIGIFVDYTCLHDSFKSVLVQLFTVLLQTIKVFESENVVQTLSELIRKFPQETQPHSIEIVKALVEVLTSIENNFADLDDNAQFNATSSAACAVTSISEIMQMNRLNPETMNIFIQIFLPYINRLISVDSSFARENLDNTLSLAGELVRLAHSPLHPQLQQLLTIILSRSLTMSFDGLENVEPVVTVFIAKQPELVCIDTNMQLIMKLISSVINSDEDVEIESICVLRISQAMLLCCEGMVDNFVEFLIKTILPKLNNGESIMALQGVEAILYCIFYNTHLTISILNNLGALNQFLMLWNSFIPKRLPTISDKKITIVALVSLLTLPIDQLPDYIKNNLSGFYNMIITLLVETENQRKKCEEYKIKNAQSYTGFIRDTSVQNLKDDEDVLYDDEVDRLEDFDFSDLGEDILDEGDDDMVSLNEREIFYEVLKRVLEGDLKDERHGLAIRNLPEPLRAIVQNVIIEQSAKQQSPQ